MSGRDDISTSREYDIINNYNPYRVHLDGNEIFVKGIPYVFMTCPALNLTEQNVNTDSFLSMMCRSSKENLSIMKHLTNSTFTDPLVSELGSCSNRLFPLVTNTALSIDIKDTVARTKEASESTYGYKQVHPGSMVDSIVGDEISIKYLEQQNLPVIKAHKVWQDYMENIRRGRFYPSKKAIDNGFIDYFVSIYYFLCDFDGETLLYWSKYTGVAPLNVPYSALGGEFNSHEIPDITINYSYCYKEDMSPAILRDFNRLILNTDSCSNLNWMSGRDTSDSSVVDQTPISFAKNTQLVDGTQDENYYNYWYNQTIKQGYKGNLKPKIFASNVGDTKKFQLKFVY